MYFILFNLEHATNLKFISKEHVCLEDLDNASPSPRPDCLSMSKQKKFLPFRLRLDRIILFFDEIDGSTINNSFKYYRVMVYKESFKGKKKKKNDLSFSRLSENNSLA